MCVCACVSRTACERRKERHATDAQCCFRDNGATSADRHNSASSESLPLYPSLPLSLLSVLSQLLLLTALNPPNPPPLPAAAPDDAALREQLDSRRRGAAAVPAPQSGTTAEQPFRCTGAASADATKQCPDTVRRAATAAAKDSCRRAPRCMVIHTHSVQHYDAVHTYGFCFAFGGVCVLCCVFFSGAQNPSHSCVGVLVSAARTLRRVGSVQRCWGFPFVPPGPVFACVR